MAVRLIIEDLDGSTTVVPLDDEEVTIGRKEHNTIQLTEQNVSRSHAKLQFNDDGWLIEDLSSYNGVKVNGVPIAEPALLRESDLIQIGDYHLTLTDAAAATVDLNRPRAANDGMGPSIDLPSMSLDDLPTSSPSAVTQPAMSMDLGGGEEEEEEEGSNKGLIFVGVLLLAGLIGVGGWLATRGDKEPKAGTKAPVAQSEAGAEADAGADPEAGADAGADVPSEVIEDVEDSAAPEPGADAGAPAADEGNEVVEEIEDPAPVTKKKSTKKSTKKPKAPAAPADPSLSPGEALTQARKAMVGGNNKKAYALAKQAYDGGAGADALSVMGVTACKMNSKSKAKAAHKKLSGSKKEMLEKVCEPLGISL